MPIEDDRKIDFDFDKFREMLAKGTDLGIEKPDGQFTFTVWLTNQPCGNISDYALNYFVIQENTHIEQSR